MISRYEAYMDGTALSNVSNNLLILDIEHTPAEIEYTTARMAKRDGEIITDRHLNKATVTITMQVREYGIADRQATIQNILKWAQGEILTTNDRPGQRLRCVLDKAPEISAKNWLDTVTLVFAGYVIPCWEEATPVTLTLTGTEVSGTLLVPGNAGKTWVDAVITPSANLGSISLTVGNTSMTISGISGSNVITISHDDNGFLQIIKNGDSILNKRSGSDELLVDCGKYNLFTIDADASVTVVFSVRGRWL